MIVGDSSHVEDRIALVEEWGQHNCKKNRKCERCLGGTQDEAIMPVML
jgi:hypothetical protein